MEDVNYPNEITSTRSSDERPKNSINSDARNSGQDNAALNMEDDLDSINFGTNIKFISFFFYEINKFFFSVHNNNGTYTSQSGARLLATRDYASENISPESSPKVKVTLARDAIEWKDLEMKYGKQNLGKRMSTSEKIGQSFHTCCNDCSPLRWIYNLFPFLLWIKSYSIKNDLPNDLITGFTIVVLHIPQGIAYGLLAGVGPINGLYVSFFPVLIYVFMGTSRQVSIGTVI